MFTRCFFHFITKYFVAYPDQAQKMLKYGKCKNYVDLVEENMIENFVSRKQEMILFPGTKSIKNYSFCIFIQRLARLRNNRLSKMHTLTLTIRGFVCVNTVIIVIHLFEMYW